MVLLASVVLTILLATRMWVDSRRRKPSWAYRRLVTEREDWESVHGPVETWASLISILRQAHSRVSKDYQLEGGLTSAMALEGDHAAGHSLPYRELPGYHGYKSFG